jgi:hypothetical protein
VQFTATQEYVDLLEEARDLLSHAAPSASLDELHRRALECLVKELRRKEYAETEHPREESAADSVQAEATARCRPSRYVPARVRRRVAERDGRRCTYVASDGTRCSETRCLELHHLEAYARGGPPSDANLTLRCRAHNALAAEEDFGRELILEKRGVSDPRQRGSSDPEFRKRATGEPKAGGVRSVRDIAPAR